MEVLKPLTDNTNVTSQSVIASAKWLVGLAVTYAAGKGWIDNELAANLTVALVAIAGIGYSIYQKKGVKEQIVSAVQVGQKLPEVESEKEITAKLNSGQITVPVKPKENV